MPSKRTSEQLQEIEDERDRRIVSERVGARLERGQALAAGIKKELKGSGLL